MSFTQQSGLFSWMNAQTESMITHIPQQQSIELAGPNILISMGNGSRPVHLHQLN